MKCNFVGYWLVALCAALFVPSHAGAQDKLGDLPFGITSFGAATDGKSLYVFGGNMGDAHSYSFEGQSDKLLQLDLSDKQRQWKEIATGNRVQGTAMVAYGDELIIVGGFQARNKKGEEKDLQSLADVRVFNTKTKTWSELPSLPEPRSSHDAAIVGSKLYVVGGWQLSGQGETQWHKTAWKMDLETSNRQWEPVPDPPFQRRALAVVAHQGTLVVIGGMNSDNGPTRAVAMFHPKAQTWSALPEIKGDKPMAGFGVSGWSVDWRLIVSSQEGKLEELIDDEWKVIGQTHEARFFHRILPIGNGQIASIGGANMEIGKFTDTEVITIRQ